MLGIMRVRAPLPAPPDLIITHTEEARRRPVAVATAWRRAASLHDLIQSMAGGAHDEGTPVFSERAPHETRGRDPVGSWSTRVGSSRGIRPAPARQAALCGRRRTK